MSEVNKENKEFTFENEQYRKTYWHTCSHILAQAVKRLHPEVKLAIGPSIEKAAQILDSIRTHAPFEGDFTRGLYFKGTN